jgi:hypothetical protein
LVPKLLLIYLEGVFNYSAYFVENRIGNLCHIWDEWGLFNPQGAVPLTESDGNEYFIRGYILPRIATKSTQGKARINKTQNSNRRKLVLGLCFKGDSWTCSE